MLDLRHHPVTFKEAMTGGKFRAVCTEVHDGDTLTAWIDTGFGQSIVEAIRLSGINAPEVVGTTDDVKRRADEARGMLVDLALDRYLMLDTYIASKVGMKKSFERYVARVFCWSETQQAWMNASQVLLDSGLVDPMPLSPV
jgi:endonuclease YncB( thermonuclease family)